jgi:phage tail P2-like protein
MRNVISFEEFYESIWLKIPEVWRNSDQDYGRPLQLLTLTLAQHFYYSFYLKIASMDELFNPDTCPEKYLPFLAAAVNWKLLGTDPVSWRNQIRHAPLLYKIKGTRKGITIAEKLIGYSVYMTELYRDYTGMMVPKEKLFNNFPLSIKVKPWFRKTTPDIAKDIFNESFSDLLPSFNYTAGDISEFGSLLLPRQLKKTGSRSTSFSTLSKYDPITGEGSLARLAKLPRINVVFKKDLELDHVDSTGRYTDANLNQAVDLFLQFKPFHVYINDLVVMYSLSDYIFGSLLDKTAGTGELSGDAILYREGTDIYVTVQEEDKISYYNQEQLGSCDADNLDSSNTTLFKGNIETKHLMFDLTAATKVIDTSRLTKLGLSLSGYARNYQTAKGLSLWGTSDFSLMSSPDMPGNPTSSILMDSSGTVKYTDVFPEPIYSFLEIPIPFEYSCNLRQLFGTVSTLTFDGFGWPTSISSVTTDPNAFCKDSIVISGKPFSYDPAVCPEIAPISLKGVVSLTDTLVGLTMNYHMYNPTTNSNTTIPLLTGDPVLNLFRALVKENMLIIASAKSGFGAFATILTSKVHYAYDSINNSIILNSKAITNSLIDISHLNFHILYAGLIPTTAGFSLTNSSRNINISDKRIHTKFNRITYVDNSAIQTEIDTAHYSPEIAYDDATGTLIEDYSKTRVFRENLPRLFTRNTLHLEDTGTSYKAVNYNVLSARDTSFWTVYTDPAATLYRGAERLAKTIWANYHNVPFLGSATTAYDSIDTSGTAQLSNRQSFRWLATLENIPVTHPQFFAASRMDTDVRNSLWTRGSAQKLARPYIGSSRASNQGFRQDYALFNRTENLPDYHISLLSNYNTDNYKYSTNSIDYTDMYRNPTIPFTVLPLPNTEAPVSLKAKLINGKIYYPTYIKDNYVSVGYIPQYDGPFDFSAREMYATGDILKLGTYANNFRIDMCPYSGDLLDDFADPAEINIDGLQKNYAQFVVNSPNDSEFVLPKTNIFISWREVNTGNVLGTGLFPLVDYTKVRPSVKVLHNGLEVMYGVWTLASNPTRVLTNSLVLAQDDTISVEYFTVDGVQLPTYPADPLTGLPFSTTPATDSFVIPLGFSVIDKENIYEHTFEHNPIISWYRGDTGDFISVSVSTTPTAIAPSPKLYRELAQPNVTVRKNGIDVAYGTYWDFAAVPNTPVSYRVRFLQSFLHALQPNDSITISYTALV